MVAQKLMSLSVCGYHLPKLVRAFSRPEEWASRVMDPLVLNLVTAAECGKTSCFLWEFLQMAGPEDEKTLSRQVETRETHGLWIYHHKYTMFEAAMSEDYLVASIECQVALPTKVLEVQD